MASITISRGTPFSAASWVMAVTNSLFMLACPPLFHCESVPPLGPYNKRSGGHPLLSVASVDGSVWPCRAAVYHRPRQLLGLVHELIWQSRPATSTPPVRDRCYY